MKIQFDLKDVFIGYNILCSFWGVLSVDSCVHVYMHTLYFLLLLNTVSSLVLSLLLSFSADVMCFILMCLFFYYLKRTNTLKLLETHRYCHSYLHSDCLSCSGNIKAGGKLWSGNSCFHCGAMCSSWCQVYKSEKHSAGPRCSFTRVLSKRVMLWTGILIMLWIMSGQAWCHI